jgi:hypothetical protein
MVESILAVERPTAVFIDAIECAQGAFLAGDAPWTQRHFETARAVYSDCGKALLSMADALERMAGQLQPAGQTSTGGRRELAALLEHARQPLGLSRADEIHILHKISPALSRGVPTQTQIRSMVETTRRHSRRLTNPVMADVRFVFTKTRPR